MLVLSAIVVAEGGEEYQPPKSGGYLTQGTLPKVASNVPAAPFSGIIWSGHFDTHLILKSCGLSQNWY